MEDNNGKNKDSEFINEVVKDTKRSKKSFAFKIVLILILSAAAATVAAVVFVLVSSAMRSAIGDDNASESKISISDSSSESSSVSITPTITVTPAATATPTPQSDEEEDSGLTIEQYKEFYDEMRDTAEEARKSLVSVTGIKSQLDYFNQSYENEQTSGGLIIAESNEDYYILTQSSILDSVEKIRVSFDNGYSVDATLQRIDSNTSFAVICVKRDTLPDELGEVVPASLGNSVPVKAGERIIAIGNPDGLDDYIAYGAVTSSSNTVSCFDTQYSVLTTDIPRGSGGFGVLLDLDGKVIGVTSSAVDSEENSTLDVLSISGIKPLIERLSNNEGVAYIGVRGYEVTETISSETGIPTGIIVVSIAENSPAMMSGMMEYDIISSVAGQQVGTIAQMAEVLKTLSAGDKITVNVMRQVGGGYTEVALNVELGEL